MSGIKGDGRERLDDAHEPFAPNPVCLEHSVTTPM